MIAMAGELEVLYVALSLEDLQEEYAKLFDNYHKLREQSEADSQRIHELKRNLDTASAAEVYLSQELEQVSLTLTTFQQNAEEQTKAQIELDELRRLHHILSTDYATLQQDSVALQEENAELRKQLENTKVANKRVFDTQEKIVTTEQLDRLTNLERENVELLHKLDEFQESSVQHTMVLAERERNIEILRDQVTCLEENLRSKREDLDEKTNLLESTQEQLAEANSQLAMLSSKPDSIDRKGNSLFAEVDDQRQVMKKLLTAQKKNYLEMKKIFHESQSEIRRLKRENIAMHTELRECSSIFCNADRTYQDKLNERIRQLLCQVSNLEKQLNLTQDQLRNLAQEKGVAWLDSMMSFCKQETDDLKKQLHGVRIQKASLEEQLRNVKQEMARWRFESLKSRCVLLDRENLLDEHGIAFKSVNDMEFHIGQKAQENARPRIVSASPSMSPKGEVIAAVHVESSVCKNEVIAITPTKAEMQFSLSDTRQAKADNEKENVELYQTNGTSKLPLNNKENVEDIKPKAVLIGLPFLKEKNSIDNILTKVELGTDTHVQRKASKKTPPDLSTLPGPSILCKKRETLMHEHGEKNVQFSAQAPTIHDISVNVSVCPESGDLSTAQSDEARKGKTTIKQMRTKSNIVVRRVVVASKRENN